MINNNLKKMEEEYCSYGDTIHYNKPAKIFVDCDNNYMIDENKVKYLDFQMAYSAVNFGYKNTFFSDKLKQQINTLPQIASEYLHKDKIILSRLINDSIENFTNIKGRVHFNVGGAQAIDDSLKLVSINKGTKRVFAFEGSYHGRTIGASSITSSFRYRSKFGNFSERAYFIPFPYIYRSPYPNDPQKAEDYFVYQFEKLFESEYQSILDFRDNQCEYVAFYVEPIQGTGGYIIPPKNYFKRIKKILDKYNILFVVDEIQMGFFRTGKMWAIEHFGVKPDILVFGKSLTNGLNPLSGLWAKDELINPAVFPPGSTHSTFSNNPLGMALGVSTFDWIKLKEYEKSVPQKGSYLLEKLQTLKKRYNVIGDIDGIGLALRIEITHEDGKTPNKQLADKIKNFALKGEIKIDNNQYGLILDIGGYYKNVFTLAPCLEISYNEIDMFLRLFEKALDATV